MQTLGFRALGKKPLSWDVKAHYSANKLTGLGNLCAGSKISFRSVRLHNERLGSGMHINMSNIRGLNFLPYSIGERGKPRAYIAQWQRVAVSMFQQRC
jgi:hypothetical protein